MSKMSAAPVAGSDPARMVVMGGILNVTADSFSDGGQFLDRDAAIARGLELQRIGVDIVDVGGESTRPGATRVDPKLEADRIAPVIEELVAAGIRVSVDTMRASVAAAAIEAGAGIVNDVSGGRADPDMASVVADAGVPGSSCIGARPATTSIVAAPITTTTWSAMSVTNCCRRSIWR